MSANQKIWKFFETHEWTQYAYMRNRRTGERIVFYLIDKLDIDNCSFCVLGAARICYPDLHDRIAVIRTLQAKIGCSTNTWNDQPGRTKEHVVELCKELDI